MWPFRLILGRYFCPKFDLQPFDRKLLWHFTRSGNKLIQFGTFVIQTSLSLAVNVIFTLEFESSKDFIVELLYFA